MSTAETTAIEPIVVLDATGGAAITIGGDTTSLTAADVDDARRQAQRVMVDQATRRGAPVTFVAVDALGRRQLVAYPDGRVRPVRTQTPARATTVLSAEGPAGRGRVSKLPAADELQVPDRVDTGTATRGTPLGSPADAPVAARPVSTQPSITAPHDQADTPRTPRRRRRRAVVAIVVSTVVVVGAGAVWWRQDVQVRAQATAAAAADDAAAARALAAANAEATRLAEQARAEQRDLAQALIQDASEVLGASSGRVADDAVRASLEAAIGDLVASLETGDPTTWSLLSAKVTAAADVVRAAQAQWEADEAARVAAEQEAANAAAAAAAQAATRSSSKASTPTTQAPAAAAPPATSDTGSGVRNISASLSSGRGSASISVLVTTKGPTSVSVTATIAGQSVPLSGPASVDGSATFTGSLSGLPAGTQTWTATAGGLSTSGSIEVF